MSKGTLFVSIYSVVLIAMFIALCYLMTTVNPKVSRDLESSKRFDDEYLLDSKDLPPPNDIVAYGLEKVTVEYELYDLDQIMNTELVTNSKETSNMPNNSVKYTSEAEMPKPWLSQKETDNFTNEQAEIFTIVTDANKPKRDLRRSINDVNKQNSDDEVPQSLLLKIRYVDGQPRIEITVVSEKFRNSETRKYRSFDDKNNLLLNTSSKNNDYNTGSEISKSTSVVIAENGTFILNIYPNMIDLITINETTSPFKYENNAQNNSKSTRRNSQQKSVESSDDKHNFKVFNPVLDLPIAIIDKEKLDTIDTNTFSSKDSVYNMVMTRNYAVTNVSTNILGSLNADKIINRLPTWTAISQQSISCVKLETSSTEVPNSSQIGFKNSLAAEIEKGDTQNEVKTGNIKVIKANKSNLASNSLVGLLIPEATATLPLNYHFVS